MKYLGDVIKNAYNRNHWVEVILPDPHPYNVKLKTKDGEEVTVYVKTKICFKGLLIYNYIDKLMAYASHPCRFVNMTYEPRKGMVEHIEVL